MLICYAYCQTYKGRNLEINALIDCTIAPRTALPCPALETLVLGDSAGSSKRRLTTQPQRWNPGSEKALWRHRHTPRSWMRNGIQSTQGGGA